LGLFLGALVAGHTGVDELVKLVEGEVEEDFVRLEAEFGEQDF